MCASFFTIKLLSEKGEMEVIAVSLISASFLIVAALLVWVWRLVNWVWVTPKKMEKCLKRQGLKGNPYRFLYGDTKEMASMPIQAFCKPCNFDDTLPRILPFHHHIIKTYGKKSFSWIGPVARVNILDPQLIKEILINNNVFKKPPYLNPLASFFVSGMASSEDEKWAKRRKIVTPAFHLEKLKCMLPAMYKSCSEMVSKWEKMVSENKSAEFDVQPYLEDFTSDVISRTAFGSSFAQGTRIFQLQKQQAEFNRQVLQSIYIPGWRFLPTRRNRKMKELNREVRCLVRGIIEKREAAMKLGTDGDEHEDLLSLLLKSNQKEIQAHGNQKEGGLSIEDVIDECKSFYFAGQESTSNLLTWTMILLSMHPVWQVRAREEVRQVFGDNKPHFDGLSHLKVVTMVLHEVLRLYPPVPMITRKIYKETRVGEMTLLAGVHFILPLILVHHDPDIWGEDSKEFKPERFSEGISKATKDKPLSFYPFSWGPRICLGNNFAMMEAKMALAMILQHFSFELSPSYTHAPCFVATLQPQHGAHLILRNI